MVKGFLVGLSGNLFKIKLSLTPLISPNPLLAPPLTKGEERSF